MAPINQQQFGTLTTGILSQQGGKRPLSKLGVDFTLTPKNVLFGALPVPGLNIVDVINQQRVNEIARQTLGKKPRGPFDTFVNPITAGDLSATQQLTNKIREFVGKKEGENLTREDIQNFGIANLDLDLAPLEFTPEQVKEFNKEAQKNVFKAGSQPFRTGSALRQSGFRGDFSKQSQEPYFSDDPRFGGKMDFEEAFLTGRFDDDLKSPSQFAEDKIVQSNIREFKPADPNKKGGFDPAFSRAVTLQQQSGQEPEPESTFICTALYRKGLLPRNIYLCDVIYGKNINFYTYKGYEVWGKWFAKKLQNNKTIYNIFYPIFVAWSKQMAFEVSKGKYGKNNDVLRFVKRICEKISYGIGWIYERSQKWNTQ